MNKLVVLVDSNNLLYRMFHTQPERVVKGQRVESLASSASAISRLATSTKLGKPDLVVSVFDPPGRTFRNDIDEGYKADRKGMPEELKSQEEGLKLALTAMGVPCFAKPGFEADDTIGMLADHFCQNGWKVLISSNDKDILQLVSEDILVLNPSTQKIMDTAAVAEKLGVAPAMIPDFLALKGDSADQIIGVQGVADKTAAKLLNQYGTLTNLINNAAAVGGVIGKRLAVFEEQAKINVQLSTIKRDPALLTADEIKSLTSITGSLDGCKKIKASYGIDVSPIYTSSAVTTPPLVSESVNVRKTKEKAEDDQLSLF